MLSDGFCMHWYAWTFLHQKIAQVVETEQSTFLPPCNILPFQLAPIYIYSLEMKYKSSFTRTAL